MSSPSHFGDPTFFPSENMYVEPVPHLANSAVEVCIDFEIVGGGAPTAQGSAAACRKIFGIGIYKLESRIPLNAKKNLCVVKRKLCISLESKSLHRHT